MAYVLQLHTISLLENTMANSAVTPIRTQAHAHTQSNGYSVLTTTFEVRRNIAEQGIVETTLIHGGEREQMITSRVHQNTLNIVPTAQIGHLCAVRTCISFKRADAIVTRCVCYTAYAFAKMSKTAARHRLEQTASSQMQTSKANYVQRRKSKIEKRKIK